MEDRGHSSRTKMSTKSKVSGTGRVTKAKSRSDSAKSYSSKTSRARSKATVRSRHLRGTKSKSDNNYSDSSPEESNEPVSRSRSLSSMPYVLQYVDGDATKPIGEGRKIIAHICNTAGGWGKGFVLALSKRWHLPEEDYRTLPTPIDLGFVQFVPVTDDITVANMIAQKSPTTTGPPPIQYGGLRVALRKVADRALQTEASVHMPRIGTGLSRGNWDKISEIIKEELVNLEIPIFIYVLDMD